MSALRASRSSHIFWLRFCAARPSRVLPFSSSVSTPKPRFSDSSSRFSLEFRACEKTVSTVGMPSPEAAPASRSTTAFFKTSCSDKGFSLSRPSKTLRTCSLCDMPRTCTRSSSRSSSRNSPSTLASRNAALYWPRVNVSSHRATSATLQRRTSEGKGSSLLRFASSSDCLAKSSSACFFCSVATMTSSEPSFMCLMAGTLAAVAAAAAAAAASADEATAAVVVSAFISRSCCSMFREEKYERDMDMN
mmetsp:Transcript_24730/g.83121  ORF Transcript_24730/g.83121 Transcript_24730/m.83121 type:complete len:248 (-) Transcript_24730:1504-2247(-)